MNARTSYCILALLLHIAIWCALLILPYCILLCYMCYTTAVLLITAATCPVCDTLRLQLHEAEGRRTVAESQRDQLTARIAALDTTQHSNNARSSDTNIRSGSGNSDRAASAFNGSDSEPLQAKSTSVPGRNDVMR
jgi:hypothetical protein